MIRCFMIKKFLKKYNFMRIIKLLKIEPFDILFKLLIRGFSIDIDMSFFLFELAGLILFLLLDISLFFYLKT